jgi:hypothetical protein
VAIEATGGAFEGNTLGWLCAGHPHQGIIGNGWWALGGGLIECSGNNRDQQERSERTKNMAPGMGPRELPFPLDQHRFPLSLLAYSKGKKSAKAEEKRIPLSYSK